MYATNLSIANLLDTKKYGGNQFSEHLYRSDEAQASNLEAAQQRRKSHNHNHQNDNGGDDSDVENEAEKQQENSRCETCRKTFLTPTMEQSAYNDECRKQYRKMVKPTNFRNEYVVSADPVAYCYKDVLVWAPEKLVQGGLKSLCCWDPTCAGHSQTTTKGKTIISIHDVEIRRVDGLEDFLFSSSSSSSSNSSSNVASSFIIKSKEDVPFTLDERSMIKQWGTTKKGDATEAYLFRMHKEYFYSTLQYARTGRELKKVWDNHQRETRRQK